MQPHADHVPERLIVQIGDPRIDLEILQHLQDTRGRAGQHGELQRRMMRAARRGQHRHQSQRGRDHADAQMPAQPFPHALQVLAHRPRIADQPAGPDQHPLPLRRQPEIARTAPHQHDTQLVLELLDSGRQGRLRHPARIGGTAEALRARDGDEVGELVQHGGQSSGGTWRRQGEGALPAGRGSAPAPRQGQVLGTFNGMEVWRPCLQ